MNKSEKKKQKTAAGGRMTLLGYYNALPPRTFPKTQFVEDVAARCGVDEASVRNWFMGRNRPKTDEQKEVLSQMTGIPVNELWPE